MKQSPTGYVTNRVLKINVGFLLNTGPGHSHNSQIDVPRVRVSDDLTLQYVRGPLRLSRTKEGILVQAELKAGIDDECYRCLTPVEREVRVQMEELYAYHSYNAEFRIDDDAILDLGPLLRAEVLIETSKRTLCAEDCKGMCANCGANLNHGPCECELDEIDPRLAALKKLLDTN